MYHKKAEKAKNYNYYLSHVSLHANEPINKLYANEP